MDGDLIAAVLLLISLTPVQSTSCRRALSAISAGDGRGVKLMPYPSG